MAARASGYQITEEDVGRVIGMVERGDRSHDIAAWFGVNQGRIKETKDGKYGPPKAAPANKLPPRGAPGVKGRVLYGSVDKAIKILATKGVAGFAEVKNILEEAKQQYNTNEK